MCFTSGQTDSLQIRVCLFKGQLRKGLFLRHHLLPMKDELYRQFYLHLTTSILDCFSEYSDQKPVSVGVESVESRVAFSIEKQIRMFIQARQIETVKMISRGVSLSC